MAGSAKGYIVDTNVLVSRKLRILEEINADLYVTVTVVLEYLNWVVHQRNKMLQQGMTSRAKGYERLLHLFPRLLESLDIGVICDSLDAEALQEAATLVTERGVDPGDALIAVTARRLRLGVISQDNDWERLRDYVEDWLKP